VQVRHEDNLAVHAADYEGRPNPSGVAGILRCRRRSGERAAASRRKGWLATFRDATLFKVVYGWRRRDAAMLDMADFAANPAAPELGRFGCCTSAMARRCGAARHGATRWPR